MTTFARDRFDYAEAARALLRSDLAVSAAWPSEAGIRLPARLKSLGASVRRAERLIRDVSRLQPGVSASGTVRFVLRHPQVAFATFGRTSESSDRESEAGAERAALLEAVDAGRRTIFDAQSLSVVERRFDKQLFGGHDRDNDGFVRLLLRESRHDVALPGTDSTFRVVAEPRLLLHQSGVVQLTIAMPVPVAVTTGQLARLAMSDRTMVRRSVFPEPLLRGLGPGTVLGQWLDELDAGARQREMTFPDPTTMAELLQRHLEAVGDVVHARLPTAWNTYATVLASAGSCCGDGHPWSDEHRVDIARVATRFTSSRPITSTALLEENFSISPDHQYFVNLGSATRITLRGPAPEPVEQLDVVLLLEHTLLQYMRLHQLEARIRTAPTNENELQRIYAESLDVFSSMRQGDIRYGSARRISGHLLRELGGDEMRRLLERAIDIALQTSTARSAAAQARRAQRLTWVTTVLAALVAVPTVSTILEDVQGDSPAGGTLAAFLSPLRWVADMGGWGPWLVIFACTFGVAAITWLWNAAQSSRRRPRTAPRRRGWQWGETFQLELRTSDGEKLDDSR